MTLIFTPPSECGGVRVRVGDDNQNRAQKGISQESTPPDENPPDTSGFRGYWIEKLIFCCIETNLYWRRGVENEINQCGNKSHKTTIRVWNAFSIPCNRDVRAHRVTPSYPRIHTRNCQVWSGMNLKKTLSPSAISTKIYHNCHFTRR